MALKLATGAGKTTVMAMLIAWHTLNAVRHPNAKRLSKGFLIVAPGITIKDRLRVLQPNDPESYYSTRHIVPEDNSTVRGPRSKRPCRRAHWAVSTRTTSTFSITGSRRAGSMPR
ncbi:DEAD/DEAH box helicase family protein [Qipengyuania flava]|nr:DEAD/DEAH box helicase family protein [Qipengyuania flava]MBW3168116.1 DEAD/DEAH box helicase family protein [Qipengyuania flava]MBY5965354.1 DEAD/DEAH box helicase family protein [Qipengyuania flava]MBY6011678.1 DEAD/DEAH box helicase family protein [Qipengyuania flava]MBY6026120.1 DEAD/DEAH box helicase family protein [Qipengyuania flava]